MNDDALNSLLHCLLKDTEKERHNMRKVTVQTERQRETKGIFGWTARETRNTKETDH